jgi:hypothetical protein
MLFDEIFAFEMRDARLLVGIGDGRIDQMPDAGGLRRVGGNDALAGFLFRPGLVAVAHQKHGVDITRSPRNGRRVTEIAGHDIGACRRQPPRRIAVGLAGQRRDAMPSG